MRLAERYRVILSVWLIILAYTSENLSAAAAQESAKPEAPPAQLERSTVPAAGRQQAILNVTRFGRYSILTTSPQGTALQLVDRMAGPDEIAGSPGERDGRLDVFLERGQYQIITHGHLRASGMARLELHPFVERNLPQPPQLIEFKLVEQQLRDFEQLSFWLDIKQRRQVILEAAGRSLADLRLWKDGNWLVDVSPATQIIYPKTGQPLLSCRLSAELDPGLYLLIAYGGPPQPWSEESKSQPFYLRSGIPRLGVASRRRFAVSPFGQDRYLVPGPATYFRLAIPEARSATLQVDWFKPERPFEISGPSSEISKKSVPPITELLTEGRANNDHIIVVTAEAGQPFVLQQFELKYEYSFRGTKEYWISTIHSGFAADSVDATAIVASFPNPPQAHIEPFLWQTLEIGSKDFWHRRVNLLDQTTLFLHIKEAGTYQLMCQGLEAQYRIEPFFTYRAPGGQFSINRPASYQPPPAKPCGTSWDLDAGYYVLTIFPVKKGIADLLLRPMGLLDMLLSTVGWEKSLAATPFHGSTRFPRVLLDQNRSYTLYLNQQPQVKAGVILRSLPLDLNDPLYVAQEPSEAVSVPFQVTEAGVLRAEAEDGSLLEISVDGGPWQSSIPVNNALHTAAVRHSQAAAVHYTLGVVPQRLETQTPLPPVSQQALEALPVFPVINETAVQYGDLQRGQSATFLMRADRPALYQLQSTGLLATAGNLRSRTNPSFVRESQNGVGRNFSLRQYLREGDYQITVKTEGNSAGHFGLELAHTSIRNGGFLTSRIPARATLAPGQAIAYYFTITNPGEFRLRALGEGRVFHCRLEDKDGWPVLTPNIEANLSRYFSPGQYRLVILPEVTMARVVTQIEPTPRPRRYQGHGPHALRLAERIDHVWMEPENAGPRTPDQWEFVAPAPLEACVELSGEMQGNLLRLEESGNTTQVAFVPPGRCWKGRLAAGRYRFEAVAMRRNNRAPYQVGVWPTELVAGLSREVHAPVSIPLSVGKTSLVELSSFGTDDVQARLYNNQGQLIAANDDQPDDWNFLITRALPPGQYRLEVDPAGKAQATTIVSMLTPPEEEQSPLSLPAQLKPVMGRAVQLFPLPSFPVPVILAAAVDSNENIGLALEVQQAGGWHVLASRSDKSPQIQIPLGVPNPTGTAAYRLRIWALDRRETRIGLRVESIAPLPATEDQLQTGLSLASSVGAPSSPGAFLIKLHRPGLFQVEEDAANLCWSAGFQEPCQPVSEKLIVAPADELWVTAALSSAPGKSLSIRAHRLILSSKSSSPLQFPLRTEGNVRCDLATNHGSPVLLLASSQEGQPAVQLVEREQGQTNSLRNTAISPRGSASVLLASQDPAALVWAATPESAGLDVRLNPYYYQAVEPLARKGIWDGALEGIRASTFSLADGPKRFHLALGNAIVAILSKGNEIESVHWQGGNPIHVSVDSTADRLTLLHTQQEQDRYAVEVIPLRSEQLLPPLAMGSPYEQSFIRSGVDRLAVLTSAADGPPLALHVRGVAENVTFVGNGGQVLRGTDFVVPSGGGILEIAHDPGLLLCWLDQPGKEAQGMWSAPDLSKAELISLPATRNLQATAGTFQISTEVPILLHVRMVTPSVSLLKRGSEGLEVEVHPDTTLMEAYLPAGVAQLCLRAVGGGTLSTSVEFTATPVTSIGEGLGPEVLLAPGDSRLYSFEVKQAGAVGVGVRASSDVVESVLLSSSGKSLGNGAVQMLNLQPGTYLLALRTPAQGIPVRARPAVVGIVPPGKGPPEEVIRKYLEPEEAPPQFTSKRRKTPVESITKEEAETEESTGTEPPEEPPDKPPNGAR